MIHKFKSEKGMTLVEIIVAIAILGIIIIGILAMYRVAYGEIFIAGSRTEHIMNAREIADDLSAQNNIQKFSGASQIAAYLDGKGYHQASSLTDIKIKYDASINYFVSAETVKGGVAGYEVTILQFLDNDKSSVQLTEFIVKGGDVS